MEQPRERSSAPLHHGVVDIEKGAFWSPSTTVANFTYFYVGFKLIRLSNIAFSFIIKKKTYVL